MASPSPAELTVLVSATAAAIATVLRAVLLTTAALTAMYAKTPARRKAAEGLTRLLLTLPWLRSEPATSETVRDKK